MTDVPPSRWKVIERGRRLEVIDRLSGEPVARHGLTTASAPTASPPTGRAQDIGRALTALRPRQTRFDGGGELTTHPWYDDKGPRTLTLDGGSAAMIGRVKLGAALLGMALVVAAIAWPWVLLVLVPLFQGKARERARAAVTRWLDTAARERP